MLGYNNFLSQCKTAYGKLIGAVAVIAAFITVIDYFSKWSFYSKLFEKLAPVYYFLINFLFEILLVFALCVISFFLWKLHRKFEESKPNALEEQIKGLVNKIDRENKVTQEANEKLVKTEVANLKKRIFDIEYTLVEFEIEHHRSKNQVGELSNMIKKLHMDIKQGWGADDTLMEIREYIKKSGMPHFYIEDLNKALALVNNDFLVLTNEIKTLSQEKLYKVR